jgi:hypothetical protein
MSTEATISTRLMEPTGEVEIGFGSEHLLEVA